MTATRTRESRVRTREAGTTKHGLSTLTGVTALGLDAIASVAYGPEAIVLVLAAAGSAGLGLTLPVTCAIVALLVLLVLCYRQVITAFPDGGGAYTVARTHLGERAGLLAAASLVVDYVLNVAVSIAAGIAALTSAFPSLLSWTPELCVAALIAITVINLRGVLLGARLFAVPAVLFVLLVGVIIVVGLLRGAPTTAPAVPPLQSTGVLLILAAFGNGCSALTGVEAIANATPSFRRPASTRARSAEAVLGLTLGALLLGLAAVIERLHIHPVEGRSVLSLLAQGALGSGPAYVLIQLVTVVLLALAANTSFAGLPVLAAKLARDDYLPHVFGLRADRLVHRYGIGVLAALAGVLLIVTEGRTDLLVPMFAIGVFVGFTLCQVGMIRHWAQQKSPSRLALNALGAVLCALALALVTVTKFAHGAWLIVLVIPALMLLFTTVRRGYRRIGERLEIGTLPPRPCRAGSVVVVPVVAITRLAAECLSAALSMSEHVIAVHVCFDDEGRAFGRRWQQWRPEIPLVQLDSAHRTLGPPIARYLNTLDQEQIVVLIGELAPSRPIEFLLRNRRGGVVARAVERHTRAAVCRLRVHLEPHIQYSTFNTREK